MGNPFRLKRRSWFRRSFGGERENGNDAWGVDSKKPDFEAELKGQAREECKCCRCVGACWWTGGMPEKVWSGVIHFGADEFFFLAD